MKKTTRQEKIQLLNAIRQGDVDPRTLRPNCYIMLPSRDTPGNWLILSIGNKAREYTSEQYSNFLKTIGCTEDN